MESDVAVHVLNVSKSLKNKKTKLYSWRKIQKLWLFFVISGHHLRSYDGEIDKLINESIKNPEKQKIKCKTTTKNTKNVSVLCNFGSHSKILWWEIFKKIKLT